MYSQGLVTGRGIKLPLFPVWHLWHLQKCLLASPTTSAHGPPAQEEEADDKAMSFEDRANLPHEVPQSKSTKYSPDFFTPPHNYLNANFYLLNTSVKLIFWQVLN